MTGAVAAIATGVIGLWLLRHPYLRSIRVVGILIACAGACLALAAAPPPVGTLIPPALVLVAPVAAFRFGRAVSALPPPDYDESQMIRSIRETLRRGDATTQVAEARAKERLMGSDAPSPEWETVRKALLEQIDLVAAHRRGDRELSVFEATASWRKTVAAWNAAIEARRRFLR